VWVILVLVGVWFVGRLWFVGMCITRWLIHCMFGDGCCGMDWWGVGIVGVNWLDLNCVEERGESVDFYSMDWVVLLVVVDVDTQCLVRWE